MKEAIVAENESESESDDDEEESTRSEEDADADADADHQLDDGYGRRDGDNVQAPSVGTAVIGLNCGELEGAALGEPDGSLVG